MHRLRKVNKKEINPEEALQQFLFFKKAQGLADTTIKGYDYQIKTAFKDGNTWDNFSNRLNTYMSDNIKPHTFNIRIRHLKAFFRWCYSEGIITDNPLDKWKLKKAEPRIVNIPKDILLKLIEAPDHKTFYGVRDYALILLQLDTGIRPKEALTLTKDDICFNQMLISVKASKAKTRVSRSLPISIKTSQAIKKLLSVHHELWKTELIFCTCDGNQIDRNCWSKRLAHYSEQIGFKIRPYDLRHCFALYFLRAGGNVFSLQRIMGHSTLSMTQNYIALTDQDLQEQHQKSTPLNIITKSKRVKKIE